MSGRTPAGKIHEKRAQGSKKHANIPQQGRAARAAEASARAKEADFERTQPELSPEDRERFRGSTPVPREGTKPRRTSSTRAGGKGR